MIVSIQLIRIKEDVFLVIVAHAIKQEVLHVAILRIIAVALLVFGVLDLETSAHDSATLVGWLPTSLVDGTLVVVTLAIEGGGWV